MVPGWAPTRSPFVLLISGDRKLAAGDHRWRQRGESGARFTRHPSLFLPARVLSHTASSLVTGGRGVPRRPGSDSVSPDQRYRGDSCCPASGGRDRRRSFAGKGIACTPGSPGGDGGGPVIRRNGRRTGEGSRFHVHRNQRSHPVLSGGRSLQFSCFSPL